MIRIKAPNGLLVRKEPFPSGPLGVGWTSTPSEARTFASSDEVAQWAQETDPDLAKEIMKVIERPAGAPVPWGDLRLEEVM